VLLSTGSRLFWLFVKYRPGIRPEKEASHVLSRRLKKATTLSVACTRQYGTTKPPNITDINAEIRTKWHMNRSAFVQSYVIPAFSVHYHKEYLASYQCRHVLLSYLTTLHHHHMNTAYIQIEE